MPNMFGSPDDSMSRGLHVLMNWPDTDNRKGAIKTSRNIRKITWDLTEDNRASSISLLVLSSSATAFKSTESLLPLRSPFSNMLTTLERDFDCTLFESSRKTKEIDPVPCVLAET